MRIITLTLGTTLVVVAGALAASCAGGADSTTSLFTPPSPTRTAPAATTQTRATTATSTAAPSPTAGATTAQPPTGAATPAATAGPPPTPTATDSSSGLGPASHEGARTLTHIQFLADTIGPRVSGSAAEQAAINYIRGQLEAYGYAVELQGFDFEGDRFQPATVVYGGSQIAAFSLAGSAGGEVSGRAVYVGLADLAGIGGRSLAGAIAIADRGLLRFAEKYDNVRAAGAVGLVVANNDDGTFSGDLQKPAVFPVVGVSQLDGVTLKLAAKAGAQIGIDSPVTKSTHSSNLIARPAAGSTCNVLVGGHHDTVAGAPGANDNASGSATVLELARAFAADGLDAGLCFATFGGEESGLYGSHALVEQMKKAGTLPRVMVNLDVTGIGAGVAVIGSPDPVQRAVRLATQLGIPALAAELPANAGSDHQSFRDAGVSVVFFTSGEFANIHSPRDVAASIDVVELDRVGDLAYATIRDLLGAVAQR